MKRIVVALLLGALAFGLIADAVSDHMPPPGSNAGKDRWQTFNDILEENEQHPVLKTVFVISFVVNILLLFALLVIYLISFHKTKSYFTLGLSFFIGVLLMQRFMFFFFPLVPQLFETLALVILLILSLD